VLSPALAQGVNGPEDVLRLPLLAQSARRDAWQQWFAMCDVPFPAGRAVSVMGHVSMLAQAACAGAGAALLPTFLIQPELQSGALVCRWIALWRRIATITSSTRARSCRCPISP
jgi:LysR family glycine cleavage system transcriptional activator